MTHPRFFRRSAKIVGAVLAASAVAAASLAPATAQAPALPPDLARLRAALEKYQDPLLAVRDGYLSTLGCVEYGRPGAHGEVPYKVGGMGIHFINPQLVGPVPDPMRPAILLYEPVAGKLRLVGVEWFVPLATGVKERPTVFGQPFDGPMEGHEPLLPQSLHHYDLHAWLWKPNPYGLFSPTHPDVKCAGYSYIPPEEPPRIVPHR